jgi:acyl carrier protein
MISDKLKKLILKVLKLKEFDLHDETTAYQIPGWDSLSHVVILATIEKEYGIRFKTVEVLRLKNLEDLQKLINTKVANVTQ